MGGPTARADRAGPSHSVRRAALRSLPRRVQRAERPALQFDVRADRPRHVLRHHDRGHRPFGRNDGGLGERGLGDAVAAGRSAGIARRPRRRRRGRHDQRLHGDADADPAVHRHAVGRARGERNRAAAGAQPVGFGLLRHRFHLARARRFSRLSRPRLDRRSSPMSTARSSSTTPASAATSWRSAATKKRRA